MLYVVRVVSVDGVTQWLHQGTLTTYPCATRYDSPSAASRAASAFKGRIRSDPRVNVTIQREPRR